MKLNRFGLTILLLVFLAMGTAQAQTNQCEARFGLLPVPTNEALQTTTGRNDHFPMGKNGIKQVPVVQNKIYQSIHNLTQHLDPETQEAFKNLFGQGGPFLNADIPTIMADALSDHRSLSQQLQNFMGVESFADGELLAEIARVTKEKIEIVYDKNRTYDDTMRIIGLTNREYYEVRKRALRYFKLAIQEDSFLQQHPEIRDNYESALLLWGVQYSMVSFNLLSSSNYTIQEQYMMNNDGNERMGYFAPVLHTAVSGGASYFTLTQLAGELAWASLYSTPEGILAALASGTVFLVAQAYRGKGANTDDFFEGFVPDRTGTFISPLRIFFKKMANRARRRKLRKHALQLQEALQSGQMQLVDGRSRRAIESANTIKEDGEVKIPMIEREINLDAHIAQIRALGDDQNEMEYALSQFVIDGQKLITKHSLNSLQGDSDFTRLWETLATLKPNREQRKRLEDVRANPLQPVERLQEKSEQLIGVLRSIRSTQKKLNELNVLVEERMKSGVQFSEETLKRLSVLGRSIESLVSSIEGLREVTDSVSSSLLEGKIDEALSEAQGFPQFSDRILLQSRVESTRPQFTVVGGVSPKAQVFEVPIEQLQLGSVSSIGLSTRFEISEIRLDGEMVSLDRLTNSDLKKLCKKLSNRWLISKANIKVRGQRNSKFNILGFGANGKKIIVEVFESAEDGSHLETNVLYCKD